MPAQVKSAGRFKSLRKHQFFLALPASSMIVVDRGWVVVEWGDPAKRIKLSSVRKSILSALWLKLLRPSAGSSPPRQHSWPSRGHSTRSCHRSLLRAGAILRRRAFFVACDMPGGPAAIVGELPRVGPRIPRWKASKAPCGFLSIQFPVSDKSFPVWPQIFPVSRVREFPQKVPAMEGFPA
jgi:hypothetical protein